MQAQSKHMKWIYSTVIVIMGILLIIYSLLPFLKNLNKKIPQQIATEQTQVQVAAAIVGHEALSEYITLNGVTRFLKMSTIRSHVTGYVSSLTYGVNSLIKQNDLFCTVKTKEQDALREIQRIDTSLKRFNKPLSVYSNASGLITTLNIHNGDYVSEGDVLAIVTEPSSLILVVNVPFEYNRQIHIGTPCEVILSDKKKMNLSINGILPTVEASSQTQSYYIKLPETSLPENLNVTLHLITKKSEASSLTVPVAALQTDELEREYWVMKIKQGMAYKTTVQIGSQNQDWVEIVSGDLHDGDSIVTEGSYQLDDSSRVIVQH